MTEDPTQNGCDANQESNVAPTIRLDQFLKLASVVGSGGQAKQLIQAGEVEVNGEVETRRRRQLRPGDVVTLGDIELVVEDSTTTE